MSYPESFDTVGGGGRNGGNFSPADLERLKMAQYMKEKDKKDALKKEEARKKAIDAKGIIFLKG